jgi:hypothetical protein
LKYRHVENNTSNKKTRNKENIQLRLNIRLIYIIWEKIDQPVNIGKSPTGRETEFWHLF